MCYKKTGYRALGGVTVAVGETFPSENDVAGRLRLSGSDAMGPNPWTRPRPNAHAFGLKREDLSEADVAARRSAATTEVREFPTRLISAYLVPLVAFVLVYFLAYGNLDIFEGKIDLAKLPPYEWAAYLGASLILGALAAYLQTRGFVKAQETRHQIEQTSGQREQLMEAESEWRAGQALRTTTAFWRDEIRKMADEKGSTPSAVFAQEVGKLFLAWGWNVKLNQRAQDYGVDIFANGKDGSAVIQCKHMTDGPGAPEVRELAGSRHAFDADFGLLISIHPPSTTRQTEFFSDKAQLEFWHLGHILEQAIALYTQRTGEAPPADPSRLDFLNPDGTPIIWHADEKEAAE